MKTIERKCNICGKSYLADERNIKRGWGLCCSKSCAAKKRERKSQSKRDKLCNRSWIEGGYGKFRIPSIDDWMDHDQWGDEEYGTHS